MVVQFPKSNVSAIRRSQSVIGGLSADHLDDAPLARNEKQLAHRMQQHDVRTSRSTDTTIVNFSLVRGAGYETTPNNADTELRERVTSMLRGVVAFRNVQVDVAMSEVTVRGTVSSEFEKQLLWKTLKRISSAKRWIYNIRVDAPKVIRERWRERRQGRIGSLREFALSKRSCRWTIVFGLAVMLLMLAPWSSRGHGVETVAVKTRILFENQLAIGAFVMLHPIGESPLPRDVYPAGYVQPNGEVKFGTFGAHDGVPPGDYLVTVRWNKLIKNGEETSPGPNVLPQRYLLPMTSGLRMKVEIGMTETPPLNLTR